MPIHFVACVFQYQNRLCIGARGGLIVPSGLKHDLAFFRTLTKGHTVVMGRRTWDSLPEERRPLKDRVNIVLTRQGGVYDTSQASFMDFDTFRERYRGGEQTVYVIGGGEIFSLFMECRDQAMRPEHIYLTEAVLNPNSAEYKNMADAFAQKDVAWMPHFDASYLLRHFSDKVVEGGCQYRILQYVLGGGGGVGWGGGGGEDAYLNLLGTVMTSGKTRPDRTGVGTISIFGAQLRFDISEVVPLLTTKRMAWKSCIEELLWFLRGDTDAKILQGKGVKIWDGNTSREFLDMRGLIDYDAGVLGPGYGWAMRHYGATYHPLFADKSELTDAEERCIGGFDQLEYVVEQLRTDPFSRRIMMSYWNPPDFDKIALLPCHFSCQFYVEEPEPSDEDRKMILSCLWTQRSQDTLLGTPFNAFSYAVLTYILAARVGMRPGQLICSGGDVHIYQNHVEQVKEQLSRTMRPLPKLVVDKSVATKRWKELRIEDFEIVGYFPHPMIRAEMAV